MELGAAPDALQPRSAGARGPVIADRSTTRRNSLVLWVSGKRNTGPRQSRHPAVAARLTRAWQLSHCGIQAELQTLLDTQDNGTTADVMASGDRLVALPGPRIQQDCCPHTAALLLHSRPANRIELLALLLGQLQRPALSQKGHTRLKHFRLQMYS